MPFTTRTTVFDFDESSGSYHKRLLKNESEKTSGFALEVGPITRKLLAVYPSGGEIWLSVSGYRARLLDPQLTIELNDFLLLRRFKIAYGGKTLLLRIYPLPLIKMLLSDGQNDEFLDFCKYIADLPKNKHRVNYLLQKER